MDQERFSLIAHRTHLFCCPCDQRTFDLLIDRVGLVPGDTVCDLGCGTAEMAIQLAGRHGCVVDAVDRSRHMVAAARGRAARRLADHDGPGRLTIRQMDARDFLPGNAPYRLVLAVGSGDLVPQADTAAEMLSGLSRLLEPGGFILWGQGFWRAEPSAAYLRVLRAARDAMGTHADNVAAGEQAGLLPVLAVTASEREWDIYEWAYGLAVETFVRQHPEETDADAMLARIYAMRRAYLTEGREVLGFGLYLFRRY